MRLLICRHIIFAWEYMLHVSAHALLRTLEKTLRTHSVVSETYSYIYMYFLVVTNELLTQLMDKTARVLVFVDMLE